MEIKSNLKIIIVELFYILTAALVIFVIMELLWPGIILAYLNLNWVLILWLIVGIVVVSYNT